MSSESAQVSMCTQVPDFPTSVSLPPDASASWDTQRKETERDASNTPPWGKTETAEGK